RRLQAGAAADAQRGLAGRHRPAQARRPLAGRRAGDPWTRGGGRRGPDRSLGRAPRRAAGAGGVGRAVGPAPGRAHVALPRRPAGRRGGARARPHPPRHRGAARARPRRVPPDLRGEDPVTDPFDALRPVGGPVAPDPAFAAALRARVERALLWEEPMTSTLTPLRTTPRMHTLTPYLAVVDARASIAFYVAAFGAVRRGDPRVMPDGRIGHVEVGIGDTVLMLADEFPEIGLRAPVGRGGPSQSLRLETADPDGVVASAVAAGAGLERPVTDAPYGRGGVGVHPAGHRWMVSREAPTAHPGDVVYASLWAPDAGRTRRFFDGVLGGLGALGTADGVPPTLMCCYEVTDVDAAVVAVRAAGGTADDPRDEPHGRTADCVDDQGIPF